MGQPAKKPPLYFTFTQQYDPQYWSGWDAGLVASGDAAAIGQEVVSRYEAAGGIAEAAYFITHNRDIAGDGRLKAPHIHGVIRQGGSGQLRTGKLHCHEVDAALGFSGSVARAPGRGGRIENALAYLIHAKESNPRQARYLPSEVATIRGEAFAEIEERNRASWGRGRLVAGGESISPKEWALLGDALVQKCLTGEVGKADLLFNETYFEVYARNKMKVDLALDVWAERRQAEETQRLRDGVFRKSVIYIHGPSGHGKTVLANALAARLSEQYGWRVYDAAAKNAADDYRGEEIMLFNEPSSKLMEWPDLLALLDPYNASPISARYRNKNVAAPRVMIFAVINDPVTFAFFVPGKRAGGESLDQFVRRIDVEIRARREGDELGYSVSLIGELPELLERRIRTPAAYDSWERVWMRYGAVASSDRLSLELATDLVTQGVGENSSDLAVASGVGCSLNEIVDMHEIDRANRELCDEPPGDGDVPSLAESRAALAARGIILA